MWWEQPEVGSDGCTSGRSVSNDTDSTTTPHTKESPIVGTGLRAAVLNGEIGGNRASGGERASTQTGVAPR